MPETHDNNTLKDLDALEKRMGQDGAEEDALPELEEREAPGLLGFLPLIQEFWAKKAYFNIEKDGSLSMEGFYRNGPMRLEIRAGQQLVAIDRRGRETKISSFENLADLNYQWWKSANTKTTYVEPSRPWVDSFIERKLVKRKVIYQPVDQED